ncbi:hypothetical protein [Nocardia sp. NPDC019395]|uniref:hypothetical protein n=1 Tax=Nocardia sp. NPDC019395 TaxID=3154686 RepID=UPI0033DE8380
MTYYIYDEHGDFKETDERPKSGFYYEQDYRDATLYEADPDGGEPRKIKHWGDAFDIDTLHSSKGTAMEAYRGDFLWQHLKGDPDKRKKDQDLTGGESWADKKEKFLGNTKADIDAGDLLTDFKLEIRKPPGIDISEALNTCIRTANVQLNHLSWQLGTNQREKPSLLQPAKGEKTNVFGDKKHIYDDNLADNSNGKVDSPMEVLAAGKPYAAEGKAHDKYIETLSWLGAVATAWQGKDEQFKLKEKKLNDVNDSYYKEMWEKVQATHEAMWGSMRKLDGSEKAALKEYQEKSGDSAKEKEKYTETYLNEPGLQHVLEEAPLFDLIQDAVIFCREKVNAYVDFVATLPDGLKPPEGKEPAEKKEGEGKEKEKGEGKEKEKGEGKEKETGGGNEKETGGGQQQQTGGGNEKSGNNTPDEQFGGSDEKGDSKEDDSKEKEEAAPADAEQVQDDLDNEFKDILGTPEDESKTSEDESNALGGADEEGSTAQQVGADNTGAGGGGGTPSAQPPVQQPSSSADGGMGALGSVIPAVMAASAMGGGQNPLGGGEQDGKKDSDDDDRRGEGQQVPGPGQQSPGVSAGAPADQGAAAQPAVTAPTDTGTPPPVVSTPGATVDHKLPDGTPVQLPQTVADALTRQEGNPAINAYTAYEGTPAAQSQAAWDVISTSTTGTPNEPLRTGDVIRWENNHSAILFDNGAGLHYIANGQVVALDPSHPDNPQFGKFEQYLRPSGLGAGEAQMGAPGPADLPEPKITESQPPKPPAVQAPQQQA